MNSFDLIGRISRTLVCKRRKFAKDLLSRISPTLFFKHPFLYERLVYTSRYGVLPDLNHPKDVDHLLMKLNIESYRDNVQHGLRVQCADKYAVRKYVEDKGLGEILNSLYGVYDSFSSIDFDLLPQQFVIKTNFGCGQIYLCRDKQAIDIVSEKERFDSWMQIENYGLELGEWHYNEIKRKIIIEKYLSSLGEDNAIIDYKFQCFNGKVFGVLAITDRVLSAHQMNLDHYDINWKRTEGIFPREHLNRRLLPKPRNFDKMIKIAETLSSDFPYCRVDLYEIEDKVIFGELTFTPAGNMMSYYTPEMRRNMLDFYNNTLK